MGQILTCSTRTHDILSFHIFSLFCFVDTLGNLPERGSRHVKAQGVDPVRPQRVELLHLHLRAEVLVAGAEATDPAALVPG